MTLHPLPLRAIKSALTDWVKISTSLSDVIWRNQNAGQPAYPFASLRLQNIVPAHQMDMRVRRDEGDKLFQDVVGYRNLTVSCQITVGPPDDANPEIDAHALLEAAQAGLYLPSVRTKFRTANIAVQNRGSINDIETLVDASWVSRANLDVIVRAAACITEEIGIIETVEVSGTVKRADDTEIIVDPFTIEASP